VVLEALATRPGHPVSADQLVDALWGDTPPTSAPKILQGCVVRLRKLLGAEAIRTSGHGYTLALPPDELDAQRFEQVIGRTRELLTLDEPDRAAYQLTEALSWWQGEPFADLEGWAPAETEVRRLGELRLEAEELRLDALLRAGRHREVLSEAQALVRAAPLRERRWTLLARAQYQAGQQGEALRTIHQLRAVLVEQLGIDPGPEVAALEGAILRQDASLLTVAGGAPASATCPYQGLRAFGVDDADRFFGRQQDVEACLAILGRAPLLALVGPSGSGKSSILRAGVAAALQRRGTPTLLVTPGPRPAEVLTGLSGRPPGTALLVDQFEEVFTLCEDPAEQQGFLRDLTQEATRRTVVIALRADHLVDLAAHHALSRLVEQGLYLVGGLSDEGLRAAVELPARQAGLTIEPGLVDLLVREVEGDPGALPLLSHALLETWKRREGNTLTVAGYRASGGIHGAVAQSAELLYARVEPARRPLLRDLVLRLVSPGAQGEPVRTPVPKRLVATDAEREQIVEMLVSARLVTSGDGVLEITHEALARAWPRLRGWLDDDVEGQRTRHHLTTTADAWDSLGRPDSELYRGVRLTRALDWQQHTTTTLTRTEQDFLDAARRHAEAEEQTAVERARVQARLIRRLRVVLTGAVALLVLALVAGGAAVVQSRQASRNAADATTARTSAQEAARTAQAQRAGAKAAATDDIDAALLLGVAGVRRESSPETVSSLIDVLAEHPTLIRSSRLAGDEVLALDVSPDGRHAATVDATHHVRVVDLGTGRELADAQVGAARTEWEENRQIEFDPTGATLGIASTALSHRPVVLRDAADLSPVEPALGPVPGGPWRVTDLAFSQDGGTVAAVLARTVVRGGLSTIAGTVAAVWDTAAPRRPRLVDLTNPLDWAAVALSPDGTRLYSMPRLRVLDLRTGRTTRLSDIEFTSDDPDGSALEISPDGTLLAVARGTGHDVALVEAASGRVRRTLSSDEELDVVRFDGDGRRLLTVSWPDRDAAVWDVASGAPLGTTRLGAGAPAAADLAPSGGILVSSGGDNAIRQWDVEGSRQYLRRIPLRGLPWTPSGGGGSLGGGGGCFATPSPDGRFIAYTVCPNGLQGGQHYFVLVDLEHRVAHSAPLTGDGFHFGGGSWSGARYLNVTGGTIEVWNGRTGRLVRTHHPAGNRVVELDHTPDGSRVAMAELSGRITMLDARTLEPHGRPVHLDGPVCCISAGPDDRTAFVLAGGPDPTGLWNPPSDRWALIDLERGTVLRRGDLHITNGIWAAYSPDGRHAAATGWNGEVEIIDLRTGEPVHAPVRAHGSGAFWAAFSPDGSRLVTAAFDGSVALWDSRTGAQVARITAPTKFLVSAEFLPDGHSVLIAPWARDAAVYVWDPSPQRAVRFACRAAGRDLSETEWRENFGNEPYQRTCPER
jgi:WD40 repeat protein/DNA-binding SARP family transcriptional activator